jgi:hypothetical protein
VKADQKAQKQAAVAAESEKKAQRAQAIDEFNDFMASKFHWEPANIGEDFDDEIQKLRAKLEDTDDGAETKIIERELDATIKARDRALKSQRGNVLTAAKETVKQIQRGLIADRDVREQVEAAIGEKVQADGLIRTENGSKGKGFVTGYRESAEKKGSLDPETLANEKAELFDKRIKEISQDNPGLANMIKGGIESNKFINQIKNDNYTKEDLPTRPITEIDEQAEILKKYLELKAKLNELDGDDSGKEKQINLDGTADEAEASVEDLTYGNGVKLDYTELLDKDLADEGERVKTERQAAIHSSLLDAIDKNPGGVEKWIANGNYAGFNSIALSALKNEGLDRDTVDILGVGASAKLLAMTARRSLSPEDYADFAAGMEKYHEAMNETLASDAINSAKDLIAKAEGLKAEIEAKPDDIAVLAELNSDRLGYLDEANRILGQTLGSLESSAAMVLELKGTKDPESLEVSMGDISNEEAIIRMRALGLDKGDYDIQVLGNGQKVATITGMDKMIHPVDAEEIRLENEIDAIKAGLRDEPGWMPAGLVDRNAPDYQDPGPDTSMPEGGIDNQSLGDDALSIKRTEEAAHRALGELPEGCFAFKDIGDLSPAEQTDLRRYWEKNIYAGSMAADTASQGLSTGEKGISRAAAWQKYVKGQNGGSEDAAYENIKADLIQNYSTEDMFGEKDIPKLARVVPGDYSTYRANVDGAAELFDEIDSLRDPSLVTDAKDAEKEVAKLEAALPGKLDEMFKSQMRDHFLKNMAGYTADQYAAGETRQEKSPWGEYVRMHGDVSHAQEAVIDRIKGDYTERFLKHYTKLTGKKPQTRTEKIRNADDHVLGMLHKDVRDSYTDRFKREMGEAGGSLANRNNGRFSSGSWKDKFKEYESQKKAEEAKQVDMFSDPADLKQNDGTEIVSLGKRAQGQLASMIPQLSRNQLRGQKFKVNTMTAAGTRERSIKMLEASKRMNLTFGTGKGKTIISIGAFTDLKAQGKAKRAVFAVPSVVLSQFGNEVNTFCVPGKYQIKSDPTLDRDHRIQAMKDGNNDMCIFTHQSLRDDMIYLMAKNNSMDAEAMKEHFNGLTEPERKKMLGDTLAKEGVKFDMMTTDEAHYITNREGKPDTTLSNVMDALNQNCEYYMAQTATPVKNDASEAFDMLHKVAPDRFTDRNEFMKRYGVDTQFNRRSLQRLINRYNYASPTVTGVKKNFHKEMISLEGRQKEAYDKVGEMFRRASKASRAGSVDIEAMQYLSPNSFKGKSEDEYEGIAKNLQESVGTIKEEALNRVVNQFDWHDNAKIKRTMDIIDTKRYESPNEKTASKVGDLKPGVIFAHNIQTVDNLRAAMEAKGMRVGIIQGAMTGQDKEKVKVGFNPPNPAERIYDVILCSDAGATGLNLQNAGYLMNFDLPQTAWVKTQREGRIDRMGQAHSEIDYHDIVSDTEHEATKWDRIQRKKALGSIFEEDPGVLDDTGLASHIANARQERYNNGNENEPARSAA